MTMRSRVGVVTLCAAGLLARSALADDGATRTGPAQTSSVASGPPVARRAPGWLVLAGVGFTVFSVVYGLGVYGVMDCMAREACHRLAPWMLVPVLGPLVWATDQWLPVAWIFVADAVLQAAGLATLVGGISAYFSSGQPPESDRVVSWVARVSPWWSPSGGGLAVSATW